MPKASKTELVEGPGLDICVERVVVGGVFGVDGQLSGDVCSVFRTVFVGVRRRLVVGGVEAALAGPVVEALGQRGQGLLADGVVEPLSQLGAEGQGLGLEFDQLALG